MVHRYLAVAVLGVLGISLGCAMCEDTYDYAYPAYGSVHPRADRFHGRVGSDFGHSGETTIVETIDEGMTDGKSIMELPPEEEGSIMELPPEEPELAPEAPNSEPVPAEE